MTQSTFLADVIRGLRSSPKFLMSKYFYDAEGDALFQQIMRSPEYYLTRAEMSILKKQNKEIADALAGDNAIIDLIELGAGDAVKSLHLVKCLHERNQLGAYIPIDISQNIIKQLRKKMVRKHEGIIFHGLTGEYFDMLPKAMEYSTRKKGILFLGGNMGNFLREQMIAACKKLFDSMQPGDKVLIGFDLKKDPRKILAAYNDKAGLTAAFNLNLLKRINRELNADFKIKNFVHYPNYDPSSGYCKSFLISGKKQVVKVQDTTIHFEKGEAIFTEVSQKFDVEELREIAIGTGFIQKEIFLDDHKYFADVIWEKPS